MNAVSQALRIIAIVAALAAAGLYVHSEKKSDKVKAAVTLSSEQLSAANDSLNKAKADAAASDEANAANTTVDAYKSLRDQATSDAENAKHAAEDKDTQIADLNNQIATLKDQVASIDGLKQQIASLQAAAQQAPATQGGSPATPSNGSSSTDTSTATTGSSATPGTFSTTPAPTTIIALDAKHGLIVIGAGSNSGMANDAQVVLQKAGVKVAQIQVTDAEPDYSVAMLLDGSTLNQLGKGQSVDFIRVR
jgi:hypothetical protein